MSPTTFYAHSREGRPTCEWEPLAVHLEQVAALAERFASAFGAGSWGRLGGLWHDLGKYLREFQARLLGSGEAVEHAGLGAAYAVRRGGPGGLAQALPLAFAIAGHHAGLANAAASDGTGLRSLKERLKDNERRLDGALPAIPADLLAPALPPLPERFRGAGASSQPSFELWTRFLFSALVDADYLATEAFYSPGSREATRGEMPLIGDLADRLDADLDRLVTGLPPERRDSPVNRLRAEVLDACRQAAGLPPGLFSLTVPTGGGKTLAAMAFALRHARVHGLRRVVAAIPFTSIIEQSARVYAESLGAESVIEHHSALDPVAAEERCREAELRRRLAAENWDAPVVVTTNVQLFESLLANAPSRCRKLHNLAGSVVLLDEPQALPTDCLAPVLDLLDELVRHYGCSVVLTTATQPAFTRRPSFPIGLPDVHEIAPRPAELARSMRRVEVSWPDLDAPPLPFAELATRLAGHPRALAIVHRRADARRLAGLLPPDGRFHLSALMCPAHRKEVLAGIAARLKETDEPCRLIATQLVEAGVDVDFPVVYRALGGLDSLAQAAGRCNREGRLPGPGSFVVFRAETPPPPGTPRKALEATESLLRERGGTIDLADPTAYEAYFRNLYLRCDPDARRVQPERDRLNFATVAARFHLVEDGWSRPVVVPWGDGARRLAALHRDGPSRLGLRALQPFTVAIPERALAGLLAAGAVELVADTVHALAPAFRHLYTDDFGLDLDDEPLPDPERLVV